MCIRDSLEATQTQTTMGGEVVHTTSVDSEEALLHGSSSNPEGDVLLTENQPSIFYRFCNIMSDTV